MTDRYSPHSARNTAAGAPVQWRDAAIPLVMIGVFLLGGVTSVIAAVASRAAAPPGWPVPALGAPMLRALFDTGASDLDPLIGPGGSRWVFWGVAVILAAAVAAVVGVPVWSFRRRVGRTGDPARALAGPRDYADLHGKGALERARQLRPSLRGRRVHAGDVGMRLGRAEPGGHELYASEEDTLLVLAGPRSNKTSAWVVPAVLTAPGPVIVTSNKPDVWALTIATRRAAGETYLLDPQGVVGGAQTWWTDPLKGIREVTDAETFISHFMATVGADTSGADGYFTPAAERLLTYMTLCAAATGHNLRSVQSWLATRSRAPIEMLKTAGYLAESLGLRGVIETPPGQAAGVYETALTAIRCLESEVVARYVTPPDTWVERPHLPLPENPSEVRELDPWAFLVGHRGGEGGARSRDTFYALSTDESGPAALIAALVDRLLRTAARAAAANGGRLDPPLRVVLDEAANICPIQRLPSMYSYFGSKSAQLMTFIQSYAQGVTVWGRDRMEAMATNANFYLIGAGAHSRDFCENISAMVGEHDVPTWSDQYSRGGGSVSRSYRRERILPTSDIQSLPKTHAVMLSSGRPAGLLRLQPWYTEPDSQNIKGHEERALREIRDAAITALGSDNAYTRHLSGDTGQPR